MTTSAATSQRVYVIGTGFIGRRHAEAALRLPAPVEVTAYDRDPVTLGDFGRNDPAVDLTSDLDLDRLLGEPAQPTDIVVVATPPASHAELTIRALASGRHVLCKKPLALTIDEGHAMMRAATEHGRLLACCSGRFVGTATAEKVARLIACGDLGRPYHVRFVHRERREGTDWWADAREHWRLDSTISGGGVLADWGCYDMSLLIRILGATSMRVNRAWTRQHDSDAGPPPGVVRDVEDQVGAALTFLDRTGIEIDVSYERAAATFGAPADIAEVELTHGAIRWQWRDWDGPGTVSITTERDGRLAERTIVTGWGPTTPVHDRPLRQLYARVHGAASAAVVGRDAVFGLACVRGIYDAGSSRGFGDDRSGTRRMSHRYFAMDTAFDTPIGSYRLDSQWAMIAELGYDGGYLSLWDEVSWRDLERLPEVAASHGLAVAGVYLMADLTVGAHDALMALPDRIAGATGHIDLALRAPGTGCSDASFDEPALRLLEPLVEAAQQSGITVGLYHHVDTWLEQIDDGVRLCRRLDHPALGVTFCGYHWYATGARSLRECVGRAAPHLTMANLCGSTRPAADASTLPTVEPLDRGELDNFAILAALRAAGFDGWVGIQGFSVGGDVYAHLARSLDALRSIERRVEAHGEWAVMRDDR
jgi:predicted dehydrogenase/sugar phosphate isomerase/epimerase